jgi:hypothetical protein
LLLPTLLLLLFQQRHSAHVGVRLGFPCRNAQQAAVAGGLHEPAAARLAVCLQQDSNLLMDSTHTGTTVSLFGVVEVVAILLPSAI